MVQNDPGDPGQAFLRATAYPGRSGAGRMRGVPPPPGIPPEPGAERILLPDIGSLDTPPLDLRAAIASRRSVRQYDGKPLSSGEIAYLLWATQGVRDTFPDGSSLRTVPSGGARHPFETFLSIRNAVAIPEGIYRYVPFPHLLTTVKAGSVATDTLVDAFFGQPFVGRAAVVFVWAAVPARTCWRYGARGWRDIFFEAGHICQNLYLAAAQVGCGACALGAFDDGRLASAIGTAEGECVPLYAAAIGKNRKIGDEGPDPD
jgi:SagB-type dehydrogenase family enzyme